MADLTEDPRSWVGQHFVSVTQLSRPALDMVLAEAAKMKALVQEQGELAMHAWDGMGWLLVSHSYRLDGVHVAGGDRRLQGKILGSIFFEPSTRTACSFQAAFQVCVCVHVCEDAGRWSIGPACHLTWTPHGRQRLGGTCIHVNESSSSAQKGETLSDTVRSMACYCDAIGAYA